MEVVVMGEVIQFPNQPQNEGKIKVLEAKLQELETENSFIYADIEHLQKVINANADEIGVVLKELAILYKLEGPDIEFTNEWGDDFEFIPDFNIDDNPEED
jgi:hypothetical protein